MNSEYTFDPKHRVWARAGRPEFDYSDSDEVENRIRGIVSGARDRSTASRELIAGITDWPSLYHLSPYRANLLRPFTELIRGSVLEVGSGCGALTRFFAEQSVPVTALEGSMRRARIASERCAGLPNVEIYCDNFQDFSSGQAFQLVACIGVIEYSPLYFGGADPFGGMLRRLAGFLAPGGYLLIAIENRLGLKYFAGAPEDHTGQPFQSIEDRYSPTTPETLGKREWEERLRDAGLEPVSAWYPFPDYKIPRVIISSAAFQEKWLDLGGLLRFFHAPDRGVPYERTFSEAMVWPMLVKNGLAEDLANSFVLVARRNGTGVPAWKSRNLLYHCSTDRLPEYAVEMTISGTEGDAWVRRRRLFAFEPAPSPYAQHLADEPYLPGELHWNTLYRILTFPGWTLNDVAGWARPWVQYLRASASPDGAAPALLPPEYLDCIPSNLIRGPEGNLRAFDLEFAPDTPPLLSYVVFRGLYAALMRSGTCARPAEQIPGGVAKAAFAVMHLLELPVSDEEQEDLLSREARLQAAVRGVPVGTALQELRARSLHFRDAGSVFVGGGRRALVVQIFWIASRGLYFRESDSCHARTPKTATPRTLVLGIPVALPSTALFRVDLSNQPGLAQLFGMRLLGSGGSLIWEWDGLPASLHGTARHDLDVLAPPDSPGAVLHFLGDDPWLILPVPEDALHSSPEVFEVDLAWLGTLLPPEP